MHIAFFSDTFLPEINSISISLFTLANELANRGHDVSIFTSKIPEMTQNITEQEKSLDLFKIYRASDNILSQQFQIKKDNVEIIHKDFHEILVSKPDIIHIHTPFEIGQQGMRASHLLKIPPIGSHHSFYVNYHQSIFKNKSFFMKLLAKNSMTRFYNKCKLVIVPSKAIANDLVKNKLSAPITIIPNPIDIKKLQPSAPKEELKKKCGLPAQTDLSDFSLVYFGNITYEKRIHELIKVFAFLSPKYPRMRLSIIGDGPERKNLETFAKKLNVREKIIFLGLLTGQYFVDAIAANDIFITASDTENQPLPIFEAMALGLPQIVAKSPIDEYIENGITGFVTEKYSFVELSEKLAKLIENPVLRQQMSENSKKAAQKYDISQIADEYERIYKDFTLAKSL